MKRTILVLVGCILSLCSFAEDGFRDGYEKPDQTLEYYKNLRFTYAPGNGGNN